MKTFDLIKIGSDLLKSKNIPSHILDSELLLSKTLNKSREDILINLDKELNEKKISIFKEYIRRRCKYEPIAYILEEKEFWSRKFSVNKDTLIPRPDTELLVEELSRMYLNKKVSILDIGTGSGCIIISLLKNLKRSFGIGIDISKKAILIAKKNAIRHKITSRLKLYNKSFGDIFDKKFDLIVSNPPYIKRNNIKDLAEDIKNYEPRMALDGGNDGLDLIRKVIYKSKNILKFNGMLALEIGNGQIDNVSKILVDKKFRIKRVIKDYKNNVRGVIAYIT
jgi:release factor glutamine methyltransferase